MTPCILAKSQRRTYPNYEYQRTTTVFPSREGLLAYEKALETEARVDQLLEIGLNPAKPRRPAEEQALSPKLQAAREVQTIWNGFWDQWQQMAHEKGQEQTREYSLERFDCGRPYSRAAAPVQLTILGHVLTRIVHKMAQCFATLRERDAEVEVLTALLVQKRWRRGKRG